MDAKKTIKKLKGEADRARISLYLSQSVYDEFRAVCGEEVSASRVIEELMKEFIDSAKGKKKARKT